MQTRPETPVSLGGTTRATTRACGRQSWLEPGRAERSSRPLTGEHLPLGRSLFSRRFLTQKTLPS